MNMISLLLFFWFASAVFVIKERKIIRLIIYLGIFAAISAGSFLLLGAPDVAMAAVILGSFSTIIFIVCFEKYYDLAYSPVAEKTTVFKSYAAPVCFTAALAGLFFWFMPGDPFNDYLKNLYLSMFKEEVGGENAVAAILLVYRMFDTLLEALVLLVCILAMMHLSWFKGMESKQGTFCEIRSSQIAVNTIRFICPIIILVSVYLILNGHISPGGGFHGGVVAASFFVCRYMMHEIYDIHIIRVVTVEKLAFVGIVLLPVFFIFLSAEIYFPMPSLMYVVIMNLLVGLKVACGFLIIFYRFIALERS